jgi:hypothetical protein
MPPRTKRLLAVFAAGLAFFVSTSALSCAGTTHQSSQAGPTDHSSADVLQMPSGFRNVSVKCFNLQGEWFAVASASDGGSGDNLPPAVAIAPDQKCSHNGQ